MMRFVLTLYFDSLWILTYQMDTTVYDYGIESNWVVILSVAAAMVWRVKPGVTSRLQQILTAAVEKTKESKRKPSDPDIIHKTFLPLSPSLLSRPRTVLL